MPKAMVIGANANFDSLLSDFFPTYLYFNYFVFVDKKNMKVRT